MKNGTKLSPRLRACGAAGFLSPNPGEKISNYLNILRIAVSSERGSAPHPSLVRCTRMPGEMPLPGKTDSSWAESRNNFSGKKKQIA